MPQWLDDNKLDANQFDGAKSKKIHEESLASHLNFIKIQQHFLDPKRKQEKKSLEKRWRVDEMETN